AIPAQTCGNQRISRTCRKSPVCTIRAELRSSSVRNCPKSFSALDDSALLEWGLRLKYGIFTMSDETNANEHVDAMVCCLLCCCGRLKYDATTRRGRLGSGRCFQW